MDRELKKVLTSIIFQNLRILHKVTKEDTYIQNYRWHHEKWGNDFFDLYHLAYYWGIVKNPKKILEIGTRTGLSLVQLLSGCINYVDKKVIVFDRFDDGLSSPELVKKHLEYLAIPTDFLEFYIGDSRKTVPEFIKNNPHERFDWLLCDGGHLPEYVVPDLENLYKLVASRGVIVIDDINANLSEGIDVKSGWEKFKNKYAREFSFHEDLYGKGVGWAVKL